MICYRDMTFCSFWKDCDKANCCSRPITKNVESRAEAAGLPICRWADKPNCHSDNDGKLGERK